MQQIGCEMVGRPHQFKHRDVVRAFRAASAAGVPNPSVHVRCPNGTVITIDSKPDAAASAIPKPGKAQPSRSRPVK
jgi:hypothetical protein